MQSVFTDAESLTKYNNKATFNFAFNYGGRADITDAVSNIVQNIHITDEITEKTITDNLWTAGLPDVDILVRTGNEKRISNFMLWQNSNATLHFLEKYWPDISINDIYHIVEKVNKQDVMQM